MFYAHVKEIRIKREREKWKERNRACKEEATQERGNGRAGIEGDKEDGGDNMSLAMLVSHYSTGEFAKW